MERFWSKVNKGEDCWIYTGSSNVWGYGQFWYNPANRSIGAHRMAYMLEYGDIPEGHDVHHLCRNRMCVNPSHLETLTKQEHNQQWRDLSKAIEATKQRYADRTHCSSGHELTEKNTREYINKRGYTEKRCRTCHNIREAKRRKERKLGG